MMKQRLHTILLAIVLISGVCVSGYVDAAANKEVQSQEVVTNNEINVTPAVGERGETVLENKEILRRSLKSLFEEYKGNDSEFMKYISPRYKQRVDGVVTDYNDLLQHFAKLHQDTLKHEVRFVTLLQEDNKVFSHHIVKVFSKDGNVSEVEVFAEWTLENGQIVACDELKRVLTEK